MYRGMKDAGWERYLWLDVPKFAASLLKWNQRLVGVKYFTARVSRPESKRRRQNTFLEAQELRGLDIYYGQFKKSPRHCRACHKVLQTTHEKMTDVNIAVEMMSDAFNDDFDTAILVSADSDLIPPVSAIRNMKTNKRIVIAFPPERFSEDLRIAATGSFPIGRSSFAKNQLPDEIRKPGGFVLQCPAYWKSFPISK